MLNSDRETLDIGTSIPGPMGATARSRSFSFGKIAMTKKITWGATGHRPDKLGGYGEEQHKKLVFLAQIAIRNIKPDEIITGMALGWDQAVAEACILERIPFIAAIPCRGQENLWPDSAVKYYRELLLKAAACVVVTDGPF